MKHFWNLFLQTATPLVASMLIVASLTACSGDDDDEDGTEAPTEEPVPTNPDDEAALETPAFESISARYDITSAESPVQSIELTASGNYIIIPNSYYYGARKAPKAPGRLSLLKDPKSVTRAYVPQIIYGKFQKVSDTEFLLEGYGTLLINGGADNAYSLTIKTDDGSELSVPAQRHETQQSSDATNKLCRTWAFSSVGYRIEMGGQTLLDKEYAMDEIGNIEKDLEALAEQYGFDDDDDDADYGVYYDKDYDESDDSYFPKERIPTQIIFTKSGSYMVQYANGTLALSTWAWEDEANGILRYSWDYDNLYSDWGSGIVSVFFRGNQAAITESYYEAADEETPSFRDTFTWYLSEVR